MRNARETCDCGCMGVGPAVTRVLSTLGPADAREHFRAARVEFLKGIRSLIDARIENLSKTGHSEGTSVPIE